MPGGAASWKRLLLRCRTPPSPAGAGHGIFSAMRATVAAAVPAISNHAVMCESKRAARSVRWSSSRTYRSRPTHEPVGDRVIRGRRQLATAVYAPMGTPRGDISRP